MSGERNAKSPLIGRIAADLSDPAQVLRAVEARKQRARPEQEGGYVAPRNSVEQELAELWAGVLGLDRVGVHDNFFRLGGNSVTAAQLLARVRERLGADVPLTAVFDAPTVANLAVQVVQSQAARLADDEVEDLLAELERL